MRAISDILKMQSWSKRIHRKGKTIGFVPTMGFLHEGHLSLIHRARTENDYLVISIFVNPTQFGPKEDFHRYPRDFARDKRLAKICGVDVIFYPRAKDVYPKSYKTYVNVEGLSTVLCGASRPGHFRGVTTVVAKLFNIVQPTRAYFGQKDAQQAAVIKKMVADLDINLEIAVLPTMREPDGLAMSSRNTCLNPKQRQAATVLYKSLKLAQEMWAQGEKEVGTIRHEMTELIRKEPLADIEYISFADAETLKELHRVKPPALVSMAVKIGKTRLIDNIVLE